MPSLESQPQWADFSYISSVDSLCRYGANTPIKPINIMEISKTAAINLFRHITWPTGVDKTLQGSKIHCYNDAKTMISPSSSSSSSNSSTKLVQVFT